MVTVGEILSGKVTGITKFGAFVSLPDGKSGLVHISEISNSYVSERGRINLSIKRASLPPPAPQKPEKAAPVEFAPAPGAVPAASDSFEDKLKAFMKASESKMSDIRSTAERKNSCRSRGR